MAKWFETPLAQASFKERQEAEAARQQAALQRSQQARQRAFQRRQYAAARTTNLTADWSPTDGSADMELVQSLQKMRARARQLVRDSSYAKRARALIMNNVIGNGIGMQSQIKNTRGELHAVLNTAVEEAFDEWSGAESCHTGGRLCFPNMERMLVGEVVEAGEIFVREHYSTFGGSSIPYALEVIEPERLADEFSSPFLTAAANGNQVRMGVELDRFGRPVAYYFRRRHRNETRWSSIDSDKLERVPASEVIPLGLVDRWPQTRSAPWFDTSAGDLNQMEGYSEAEIARARAQACTPGAIETPEDASSFGQEVEGADGTFYVEMETEPGVYKRLNPGEKLITGSVSAPNSAMPEFMRHMIRKMCAGVGVSYASVSQDYSQSNYSSSKLSLLDDRDVYRFVQCWFIRDLRWRVHRGFLRQAVFARQIPGLTAEMYASDTRRIEQVRFKPRGWTWVDPTKEVDAFLKAIEAGMTTLTEVIAATAGGQDIEDVLEQREQELELMRAKGLVFTSSPEFYLKKNEPKTPKGEPTEDPPNEDEGTSKDESAPPRAGRFVLEVIK